MNSDSAGTISGGFSTKRSSPSTSVVSLARAARWSLRLGLGHPALDVGDHLASWPGRPTGSIDGVGVEMRVPDVEVAHAGELPDGRAVRARALGHDRPAGRVVELAAPRGDLEAGGQALEVPLEGPGKRLVEVVDVEDQVPLGRGEARRSWTGGRPRTAGPRGRCGPRGPGRRPSPRPRPGRRRRRTRPSGRSGWGPDREAGWWPGGRGSPEGRCGRPAGAHSPWLDRGTLALAPGARRPLAPLGWPASSPPIIPLPPPACAGARSSVSGSAGCAASCAAVRGG